MSEASSQPIIFDISSDEDEDPFPNMGSGSVDSDSEWISKLFSEDEKDGDDSDEVVVVSEVLGRTKKRKVEEEDDDDCVVLDGDPDKVKEVENEGGGGEEDEDELMIVGQKGQIACRDYPHARHLCAKFPFASTRHEQHCQQCHCYVCDSIAPCIYWGNGGSNLDHCHSTDKDPLWKAQRKAFKQGNGAPLPTITTPSSMPIKNEIVSRLSTISACTTSANNLAHQQTSRLAVQTFPFKFNPSLVSQQLLGSSNNSATQRMGRERLNPERAPYMHRPNILKRQRLNPVAPPNTHFGHGSTNNNYVPQYSRNPHLTEDLINRALTPQQKYSSSSGHLVPPSQSQETRSNTYVGSVASQPQAFGNQFTNGEDVPYFDSSQLSSLLASIGSNFVSPNPPSQPISQSNTTYFQNQVPSQNQVFATPLESFPQPNMSINKFGNSIPSQSQELFSQPNTGNSNYINPVCSQNQTHNQLNYSQLGSDTQGAMNLISTSYIPTNLNNQIDSFLAPEDPIISHQPLSVSDFDPSRIHENTNNQFTYFPNLDPDLDPWMGGSGVGTHEFDLGSPEATNVNTGLLFDY